MVKELFNLHQCEICILYIMSNTKCRNMICNQRMHNLMNLCVKEDHKREMTEYDLQNYESLFLRRQGNISQIEGDDFELGVISTILKGSQTDTNIRNAINKHKDHFFRDV